MTKAILFATIAAVGNAVFVYGQTGADKTKNPFIFIVGAVAVCTALFLLPNLFFDLQKSFAYLHANRIQILISGVGFFITFLGFFLLYSGSGASTYMLYAVISILTTSVGVGVFLYHEPFNRWHLIAIILSIGAIACFSYGQHTAVSNASVKDGATQQI
jgi:drug/metabolite transporter (DMT)-like permease